MRPLHRPSRPRAGFTLIEVLLTLMIMGWIMVAVTQILNATRQSRDLIQNIQERQLAGPAILDRLEADLRGLLVFNRAADRVLRIQNGVISGFDADRIDFVTTTDCLLPWRLRGSQLASADVNEVGYCLRPSRSSDDFLELFRREDFGVDEDPYEGGRFALLHDRIKGFDVQIFEEDGPEAEPVESWGSSSDEAAGLPVRLEIELTIELAPRLVREQLIVDRRLMTYRRIVHFPESLRNAISIQPVPEVPLYVAPATGAAPPPDPGPPPEDED